MSLLKRNVVSMLGVMLLVAFCLGLSGCGEEVAATWSGGSITEESVTKTIENMRVANGLTSDADWAKFVIERTYEDTGTTNQTATEKAIANITPDDQDQDTRPAGTTAELREYVIEQLIRQEIISNEIKSRDIVVSEDDVEAYVEQQRSYIESRIMSGVFESVLQRQGYANLEAYKEEVRGLLKQSKLQNDVSNFTTEDGTEISGKAGWDLWFDDMYDKAGVNINPAPSELSYEIVEGAYSEDADEGSSEGEAGITE